MPNKSLFRPQITQFLRDELHVLHATNGSGLVIQNSGQLIRREMAREQRFAVGMNTKKICPDVLQISLASLILRFAIYKKILSKREQLETQSLAELHRTAQSFVPIMRQLLVQCQKRHL